jgi:predicted negative regulator of RcsB-dependent stress response
LDVYTTEQEQIEQIKKWWNENGKAIVFGLVLGLGGLFGYRYWNSARIAEGQNASINYEHLLGLAAAGASEDTTAAGEAIIAGYPKSTYAKLSALVLAKLAVDVRDLDEAKARLQWVIDNSGKGKIKPIAQARLAQLLLTERKFDEAASLMAQIDPSHAKQFTELRGDLFLGQGQREEARAMYAKTLADIRERGGSGEIIQLKLDNLGVAAR